MTWDHTKPDQGELQGPALPSLKGSTMEGLPLAHALRAHTCHCCRDMEIPPPCRHPPSSGVSNALLGWDMAPLSQGLHKHKSPPQQLRSRGVCRGEHALPSHVGTDTHAPFCTTSGQLLHCWLPKQAAKLQSRVSLLFQQVKQLDFSSHFCF